MSPGLYYLVSFFCQFKRRSRLFDVLPMAVILFVNYKATNAPDYDDYRIAYNLKDDYYFFQSFGPGFKALVYLGNALSVDYQLFRFIVVLTTLVLMETALVQLTDDSLLVWSYTLIFPGMLLFIQIRQSLALAIVLVSFLPLVKDSRFGVLWSLLLLVVASLMHSTCVVFLVIPILFLINARFILMLGCVAATAGLVFSNALTGLASKFFSEDKTQNYMVTRSNDLTIRLVTIAAITMNIIIVYYIKMNLDRTSILINNIFKIVSAFLVLAPLLVINRDFMRFDRAIIILVYAAISVYITQNSSETSMSVILFKHFMERIVMLVFAGAMFYLFVLDFYKPIDLLSWYGVNA